MESKGQSILRRPILWDKRRIRDQSVFAALRAARKQLPPDELRKRRYPDAPPMREDIVVGSKRARALVAAALEAREME